MQPLIEAHRGDSTNAPENTLAAFARAIRLAVPWIELDIHPAADGTLMVIHDDTVDRTTDGSGKVADMSTKELQRLDAAAKFTPPLAGQRIPRLVDVLEMVAQTPTRLNIEIKASPPGADVPRALVSLLHQFGKQREYVVSSFDLSALLQVREIAPEIALALIGDGPEILAHARQHNLPWLHANHKTIDKEIISQAHAAGIHVNVWTVDDPETLPHWQTAGVDKICTNQPARMLSLFP